MWIFFIIVFSLYFIFGGFAIWLNFGNKRKGLKGIPYKQCLNPVKWFSVFYGYLLKLIIPLHVFEQYAIRIYTEDCQVCIANGKCIGGSKCGAVCGCGCDTLAKMYSPFEEDSGENWGGIIFNKKKYHAVRQNYPIKIKIEYGI